jgi:DNA-binding CsgD family transcriptional regulator
VPLAAQRSAGRSATSEALSPREIEVLRLVVAGRSNGQIGEALFISKKTTSVHVANIKGKLGAQSRTEIVATATALGLVEAPEQAPPQIRRHLGHVGPRKRRAAKCVPLTPYRPGRSHGRCPIVAAPVGSSSRPASTRAKTSL